jgi:translation initiation factor 1
MRRNVRRGGHGEVRTALVYSTDRGRVCPGCGWPADNCRCSRSDQTDAAVPSRVVAKLRVEKKGRAGKRVTVVYDLPRNAAFLKELCQELKRACGTGGAVVDDTIEVQGDLRNRVREMLQRRGMLVKG